MSVKFPGIGTIYIKWTTPTNAVGLVSKTIHLKYKHVGLESDGATLWTIFDGTGTDSDEYNFVGIRTDGKIVFSAHFSTTNGAWHGNTVLTVGQTYDIIVTYNGAATTNDPVIYINGISQTITEDLTPVGTYRSGTSTDLYVATPLNNLNPNGEIEDLRIYTGIKTAAQVAVIAGEDIKTNATIDESGLVFHAPLTMCKGLTYPTFAGSVLGAGNTFFDRINGYLGVPSGSPVGE
jgi:hypothetical protein